jgi:serine/threonine protein kinase
MSVDTRAHTSKPHSYEHRVIRTHDSYSSCDHSLSDEFLKLLGRGTFSQVLQCRDLAATAPTDDEMQVDADSDSGSSGSSSSGSSGSSGSQQGMVTIPLKPSNIVAIKVIRDVARYRHAAEKEARILQHLAASKHHPYHPARPAQELQTARGMQQDSLAGVYGVNPLLGWFRLGGHMCLVFPPLGCSLYDFLRANHFRPLFPYVDQPDLTMRCKRACEAFELC